MESSESQSYKSEDYDNLPRREFLKKAGKMLFCGAALSLVPRHADKLFASEPTTEQEKPKGISVKEYKYVFENPWIKEEIKQFLSRDEVKRGLGFDPADGSFLLVIIPTAPSGEFGRSREENGIGNIDVNGILYDGSEKMFIKRFRENGFTDKEVKTDRNIQRTLAIFRKIIKDKNVLKLYRNLLICHELSHQGAAQNLIPWERETGHTATTRVESWILKNLYDSGKADKENCRAILDIYRDVSAAIGNQDQEPLEDFESFTEEFFKKN